MWRPTHLTRDQGEERRVEAGRLLQAGQLPLDTRESSNTSSWCRHVRGAPGNVITGGPGHADMLA
jgi:hypothetical protein